ncbi:MAG: hypothetical protein LUC33_02620 [Prevotellaceae bacterium]|nr:hypothetical protein [Prevotellaceae bacterium]
MPGLLRSRTKIAVCCAIVVAAMLPFVGFWYVSLLLLAAVAMLFVNRLVWRKNMRPLQQGLSPKREIRQWHTLLIGITPAPRPYGDNTLVFLAPQRSLEASRQILLHVSSALSENGNVIITSNGKQRKGKPYTVFDIPYLGLAAKKELGLEPLERKSRYPLLYEPIRSVQLLLGIPTRKYRSCECPDKVIREYCLKKGFRLTYLET